jgi:GT2 family glycosyltransferase
VFPPQFMTEYPHDRDADVDVVMGAFFFVRRSIFEALGGFDERFFVYYEEVDFCRRVRNSGYRIRFIAGASVVHKGQGTTEQIRATRYLLVSRSRILYGLKHFPLASALLLALLTATLQPLIRVAFFAARGNFRAVGETLQGGAMLLREFPEILRASTGYSAHHKSQRNRITDE